MRTRCSVHSILIGAAFGAMTTAAARAELPAAAISHTESGGSDAIVRLAQRLGGPGDEQLTADAARERVLDWIATHAGNTPLQDADGDGQITGLDIESHMRRVVRAMMGDLNGDGVVDASDVSLLMERMSGRTGAPASVEDGDLNGDGVIDRADLQVLLEQQGTAIDEGQVDDLARAASTGPGTPWGDHAKYFSDAFPPYWPGPPIWPPYPPSHEYTISERWYQRPPLGPEPGHMFGNSQNGWPPNHYWELSRTWPDAHMFTLSDINWPANHLHSLSTQWPGNHASGLSVTWPPNHILPNSHKQVHLQSWSLLHPENPAPAPQPSPHTTQVSNHWAEHQVNMSLLIWPPNHIRQASLSWGFDHEMNLSLTWPAGHFGGMSRLWPTPTPQWPPNHMTEKSGQDPHTNPMPPLFPPDHTIYKTLKELIPRLPKTPEPAGEPTPGSGQAPSSQ